MPNHCPVCDRADLAEDLDRCPQCGADLECFRLLDALPESIPATQESGGVDHTMIDARLDAIPAKIDTSMRANRHLALATLLAGLVPVAILAAALLYSLVSPRPAIHEVPAVGPVSPPAPPGDIPMQTALARIDAVAVRLEQRLTGVRQEGLDAKLSSIDERLDTLEATLCHPSSPTEEVERQPAVAALPSETNSAVGDDQTVTIPYRPRLGDSLWKIARDHLGRGSLYPLLLELNPGLGVVFRPADGPIRVPADPQQARTRMADLTEQREGRRFFRARILPGDDWRRLSKRYYGRTNQAPRLRQLNGGAPMPAAGRVLVPLSE